MATQTTQQIVDYMKAHLDVARKAMDYVKSHPGDFETALRDLATRRGWDLSQIDTTHSRRSSEISFRTSRFTM